MTQTEFKEKLLQAKNTIWFNSAEINLEYKHLEQNLEFKGFSSIYTFVDDQVKGWEKLSENLPPELLESKKHFEFIKKGLINFLNDHSNQEDESKLNHFLNILKGKIQTGANFTYDRPEAGFLIGVYTNYPESYPGAYTYLIGNQLSQSITKKEHFNGCLLAYEFTLKDSKITERREKEKASLSKLKSDFQNSLPELQSQLVEHLKNSTEKYKEFSIKIDEFKEEKEKSFSGWFNSTKGEFENFSTKSDTRLQELENTYREKLRLEAPAKYWSERGRKLKKQGWWALGISVVLVLIIAVSLGLLLIFTPKQIYISFFDGDKSAAIRWSIIYITLISFMVFVIRAVLVHDKKLQSTKLQ